MKNEFVWFKCEDKLKVYFDDIFIIIKHIRYDANKSPIS